MELYAPIGQVEAAKALKGNRDAIARVYLGRSRLNLTSRYFSLRNFPLHLDQALQICPRDVNRFAREMGTALAVFHWSCQMDAFDVEFVLHQHRRRRTFANWTQPRTKHENGLHQVLLE